MNNLKFFICAVGEKIVGLFRNPRRNVVEMSTSEFLDVYSRMTTPWFCFVVRNYVREGDRWWHLSKLNIYDTLTLSENGDERQRFLCLADGSDDKLIKFEEFTGNFCRMARIEYIYPVCEAKSPA